ncbi:hypothetical protein H696_05629 [Fonticula alba]|uniref:Tyrosine specific protein phosphatases domain-containing protein n=1 Tax=Fonticula alba TaxID=691883 RepID=A0A058Z0W7_FONAL|nr:hypothetical protein H696_05629 [Fonticula alba]KCV67900.1 hypothetical protein H696_05629 [Fonticula alba]|eukprot:XP_009497720.1 hypothetical protein H696_05629 [Fonticula alba]
MFSTQPHCCSRSLHTGAHCAEPDATDPTSACADGRPYFIVSPPAAAATIPGFRAQDLPDAPAATASQEDNPPPLAMRSPGQLGMLDFLTYKVSLSWNHLLVDVLGSPLGLSWFDQVYEGLLLGALPSSEIISALAQSGSDQRLSAVVNMCSEFNLNSELYDKLDLPQLRLPTLDFSVPSIPALCAGVAFLSRWLTPSEDNPRPTVYVHCKAGRGRSAALVVLYVAWRLFLEHNRAILPEPVQVGIPSPAPAAGAGSPAPNSEAATTPDTAIAPDTASAPAVATGVDEPTDDEDVHNTGQGSQATAADHMPAAIPSTGTPAGDAVAAGPDSTHGTSELQAPPAGHSDTGTDDLIIRACSHFLEAALEMVLEKRKQINVDLATRHEIRSAMYSLVRHLCTEHGLDARLIAPRPREEPAVPAAAAD